MSQRKQYNTYPNYNPLEPPTFIRRNEQTGAEFRVVPSDVPGHHHTGDLPSSITKKQIITVLGFAPNCEDDPDKVKNSWGFTVNGFPCGIWDYRGHHWSIFDGSLDQVLLSLFRSQLPDHFRT